MAVEVVRELQKRMGNTSSITLVPWARGYLELQTLPNVVLFSTARTAEREAQFHWIGPIDERRYFLYIRADSQIVLNTLEDCRKLRAIGVYKDDVRDLYLTGKGFTNLERTIDNIQNVKKLMTGRIDAFAFSSMGLDELVQASGCKATKLKPAFPLFNVQLYIAMSRATPDETVQRWSMAFQALKKDKSFQRIFRKYYLHAPLPGPAVKTF